MNRDERDARREDSLRGVSELATEVGIVGPFLASLVVDQVVKPTISDAIGPFRKQAVHGAATGVTKTARKAVGKSSAEQPTNPSADHNEDSDEES